MQMNSIIMEYLFHAPEIVLLIGASIVLLGAAFAPNCHKSLYALTQLVLIAVLLLSLQPINDETLELFNGFCKNKKCLSCSIGSFIIKN